MTEVPISFPITNIFFSSIYYFNRKERRFKISVNKREDQFHNFVHMKKKYQKDYFPFILQENYYMPPWSATLKNRKYPIKFHPLDETNETFLNKLAYIMATFITLGDDFEEKISSSPRLEACPSENQYGIKIGFQENFDTGKFGQLLVFKSHIMVAVYRSAFRLKNKVDTNKLVTLFDEGISCFFCKENEVVK